MQRELLHSPVHSSATNNSFSDGQANLVNPPELLRLLARLAKHAEHLSL